VSGFSALAFPDMSWVYLFPECFQCTEVSEFPQSYECGFKCFHISFLMCCGFQVPQKLSWGFKCFLRILWRGFIRPFPCRCIPSVVEVVWLAIRIDNEWQEL
jgi:hypothetical protein